MSAKIRRVILGAVDDAHQIAFCRRSDLIVPLIEFSGERV